MARNKLVNIYRTFLNKGHLSSTVTSCRQRPSTSSSSLEPPALRRQILVPQRLGHSQAAASQGDRTLNYPPTYLSVMPNGVRVASEDSGIQTSTVGVWIDAGSRFEDEGNNGVAHYLEHMAFKGTGKRTQLGLEVEIENMGAQLNAYTSREQTVYYAKCFREDTEHAIEILSDILLNSRFTEAAIERERGVILREMQEVEQNMQEVVFDILHERAFQGSPLALTILGPAKNINSIKRPDLVDYILTHYRGPRMVIAAAGGVDHDELTGHVQKYFGHVNPEVPEHYMEPSYFKGGQIFLQDQSMDMVYGAVCVEGAGWENPHTIPMMIINSLISQWDRSQASGVLSPSRLAQRVSGLECLMFQAFNTCYKDTGLWGVYFACSNAATRDIVAAIQDEWHYFCDSITEEDVTRGKQILRTNLLLLLDGSTPICEDIGRQMLCYGRRIPVHEMDARIQALDAKIVREIARKYLCQKPVALAAVGKCDQFDSLETIQARMNF